MPIYNTHDQLKEAVRQGIIPSAQAVCLYYYPYEPRSGLGSCWQIGGPFFKTDPEAAWFNHGRKTFLVHGRSDKKQVFEQAKAWAEAQYGIKEWKRNAVRDYVPAIVQEKLPIPKREK